MSSSSSSSSSSSQQPQDVPTEPVDLVSAGRTMELNSLAASTKNNYTGTCKKLVTWALDPERDDDCIDEKGENLLIAGGFLCPAQEVKVEQAGFGHAVRALFVNRTQEDPDADPDHQYPWRDSGDCKLVWSKLSTSMAIGFFQWASMQRTGRGYEKHVTAKTLEGYRSAVLYKLGTLNLARPADWDRRTKKWGQGFSRQQSQDVRDGKIRTVNFAKTHFTYDQYNRLAKHYFDTNNVFAHLYLVLTWNLTCRTVNTAKLWLSGFGWDNDHLTVKIGMTKTDQAGIRGFPMAVFSNPLVPHICPLLSLAKYVVAKGNTFQWNASGQAKLFLGRSQSSQFGKHLLAGLKALGLVEYDPANHNKAMATHAAHSIRKGALTYASSASSGVVSIMTLALRAAWTTSSLLKTYIQHEGAGDCILGRILSGLPLTSVTFATAPAHFSCENPPDGVCVEAVLGNLFLEQLRTDQSFSPILPYLGAALLRFFSTSPEALRSFTRSLGRDLMTVMSSEQFEHVTERITIAFESHPEEMRVTGLTPTVVSMMANKRMHAVLVDNVGIVIRGTLEAMLGQGGQLEGDDQRLPLTEQIASLSTQLEGVRSNLIDVINGAAPHEYHHPGPAQVHPPGIGEQAEEPQILHIAASREPYVHATFRWEGDINPHLFDEKLTVIPNSENMTFMSSFEMYYMGVRSLNIAPLRFLTVHNSKINKRRISEYKMLMTYVEQVFTEEEKKMLHAAGTASPFDFLTIKNQVRDLCLKTLPLLPQTATSTAGSTLRPTQRQMRTLQKQLFRRKRRCSRVDGPEDDTVQVMLSEVRSAKYKYRKLRLDQAPGENIDFAFADTGDEAVDVTISTWSGRRQTKATIRLIC
jgi:hypothetical protein